MRVPIAGKSWAEIQKYLTHLGGHAASMPKKDEIETESTWFADATQIHADVRNTPRSCSLMFERCAEYEFVMFQTCC